MTYVVGLTGGIGSGKSEVAGAFAQLGVEIVDADALTHQLSARGQAGYEAIVAAFGSEILLSDGELDRTKLRQRTFEDATVRARLEAILHPKIDALARQAMAAWVGAYGVFVVPLLLERKGLGATMDRVLVVDCPEEEQVRRVVARSKLTIPEVRAIMATQLERSRRLAGADDVLDNSGPRDTIIPQVAALDRHYHRLAAARQTVR